MQWKYVMREGETSANEKPRIYLYASSANGIGYDELSALFLSAANSVIYYSENGFTSAQKDRWRSLNMIAVLVSDSLLQDEREHLDGLCAIAAECRIPVFFFRTAEISFPAFEDAYGCLHIFDATDVHKSEKKALTEHLRSALLPILGSPEELEQIKKSFDARFFLSYRQKDRGYVEALFRMIHSHPLLRDCAIWYDDALTPGEDYQKSIETELENSSLFLLLTTTTLLEQGNYVQRVEYPMAQQRKKAIVPFRFDAVDARALLESFPDMPPCADAGNAAQVQAALEEICRMHHITTLNEEPQHLYHMGLARLWGIGVLKNEPLSLSLLSESARRGHSASWFRLGSIFVSGIGVEKDPLRGMEFLERYLACRKDMAAGPVTDYLRIKELSAEENARYRTILEIISAMNILVSLYKDRGIYKKEWLRTILSLCGYIVECTCAQRLLVSRYQVVVGYEKVRDENGRWKLGRSIMGDRFVVTGHVQDTEMMDLLRVLAFDIAPHLEPGDACDVLRQIIRACETAFRRSEKEKPDNVRPFLMLLPDLCALAQKVFARNNDPGTAGLYREKYAEYRRILLSEKN